MHTFSITITMLIRHFFMSPHLRLAPICNQIPQGQVRARSNASIVEDWRVGRFVDVLSVPGTRIGCSGEDACIGCFFTGYTYHACLGTYLRHHIYQVGTVHALH